MDKTQSFEGHNIVTGLFKEFDDAGKAYNAALKLGYKKDKISVLMSEETKRKHGYERKHPEILPLEGEATRGAGVGGSLGVVTGAITGSLLALTSFVAISGIGLAVSGPIAVLLAGATAGGIAGGLVGALINIGIAENHAKQFETELKNGAILIALVLNSQEDYMKLVERWENNNGIILTGNLALSS